MKTLTDKLLARCARVTSGGVLIPELDGMRFFAIVGVILYHCNQGKPAHCRLAYHILSTGRFGVELFFVISGFILALPFAKHYLLGEKKPSLGKYFFRRVTRLEPPYIIALFVYFICLVWVIRFPAAKLLPHLASSLIYSHYIAGPERLPVVNGALWSLQVEVQFYILAPLFFMVYRLRKVYRRTVIILIPTICIFAQRTIPHHRPILFDFICYFAAGILLADVYLTDWAGSPRRHWRWDIVSAAAVALLIGLLEFPKNNPYMLATKLFRPMMFPALLFLIYNGVFRAHALNAIVRNRWLVAIGGMCYSLYLYQEIILKLVRTPGIAPWASDLIRLAACILVGGLMFVFIEKPFMRRDWHLALLARFRQAREPAARSALPVYSASPRSGR